MKFLVDMNLTPRWVATLAAGEFEAVHWSSLGPADATDRHIMDLARADGYVVLTHDLDFTTILALTNWDRPSVVQIRAEDPSPEAIGAFVIAALKQAEEELAEGAVLTIDAARVRLRILPFRNAEVS